MPGWLTAFVSDSDPAVAALLHVEAPAASPGVTRHHIGGIDVESARIAAVAVVDVDSTGSAWIRVRRGDPDGLRGLPDLLRGAGCRRLVTGDPPCVVDL